MGIYFNPSNDSFTKDKNSGLYLDKTGLLEYLNRVICTNANCIHAAFDLALQNFIFDKRQKYCIIYLTRQPSDRYVLSVRQKPF